MVKTIIPQSNQPNMTLPSSYNGANSGSPDDSTLEKDVFDGIEDIYADLEANPPQAPPSSKNDITEAQRLNSSYSSSSTSSSTSSVGMNKIVKKCMNSDAQNMSESRRTPCTQVCAPVHCRVCAASAAVRRTHKCHMVSHH